DAPAARYGLYAMTKAAVAMLTKTLALEAGRFGIRVNALAPGSTITSFTLRHLQGAGGEVDQSKYDMFVDRMKKQSPLGMLGEPEDQAYLILYLASDAARWCTGQVWRAKLGVRTASSRVRTGCRGDAACPRKLRVSMFVSRAPCADCL